MDDPDPLARAGALEEILASKDGILIDFALRKVMVGTDQELKAMVIRTELSDPHRVFNFGIRDCAYLRSSNQNQINENCQWAINSLSNNISMIFDQINPSTGEFITHSLKSGKEDGRFITTVGKSIDDQIEFNLNLSATSRNDLTDCTGQLGLNADGQMAGRITCGPVVFDGGFSIL